MKKASKNKILLGLTAASFLAGGIKAYHSTISSKDVAATLDYGADAFIEQSINPVISDNSTTQSDFEYVSFYQSSSESNINKSAPIERKSNIRDKFREASETESEKEHYEHEQSEEHAKEQDSDEQDILDKEIPAEEKSEADKILEETLKGIEDTTNEVGENPNADERTELKNNPVRGSVDEIWKISTLIGLGAFAGVGLVSAGAAAALKRRSRNKALTSDVKYFVGSEYFKNANALTTVSKEIDRIENKIRKLNIKASTSNSTKRDEFLAEAKELAEGENYTKLKKFKNKLTVEVNSIVKNNIKTTPERLKLLKQYARHSKKRINTLELDDNKSLSKALLNNLRKYNNSIKLDNKSKDGQVNAVTKILNKTNIGISLGAIKDKRLQKKLSKNKNELETSVRKSYNLTGFNKVLLSDILNNKEDTDKIKELAIYLKSSGKNYKNYKDLLYSQIKVEELTNKNKVKKAEKYKNKVSKLQNELKISDPRKDLKYYGYINKIFDTPINPSRFISSNIKDSRMNNFFDKVMCSHINKNKETYEVTVSYNIGDKINCFACSFDNKEAINLMTSKFMTTVPEKATNINIIEKTRSFSKKDKNTTQTNLSALKNEEGHYNELIKACKRNVAEFENMLKIKPTNFEQQVTPDNNPTSKQEPIKDKAQQPKAADKTSDEDLQLIVKDIIDIMESSDEMTL